MLGSTLQRSNLECIKAGSNPTCSDLLCFALLISFLGWGVVFSITLYFVFVVRQFSTSKYVNCVGSRMPLSFVLQNLTGRVGGGLRVDLLPWKLPWKLVGAAMEVNRKCQIMWWTPRTPPCLLEI